MLNLTKKPAYTEETKIFLHSPVHQSKNRRCTHHGYFLALIYRKTMPYTWAIIATVLIVLLIVNIVKSHTIGTMCGGLNRSASLFAMIVSKKILLNVPSAEMLLKTTMRMREYYRTAKWNSKKPPIINSAWMNAVANRINRDTR